MLKGSFRCATKTIKYAWKEEENKEEISTFYDMTFVFSSRETDVLLVNECHLLSFGESSGDKRTG